MRGGTSIQYSYFQEEIVLSEIQNSKTLYTNLIQTSASYLKKTQGCNQDMQTDRE